MPFEFKQTEIKDVLVIKTKKSSDNRGLFIKGYEKTAFSNFLSQSFEEDYISVSNKNVLRGLHYQVEPMAQGKLITVIFGRIFDVAVDIRKNSETFAQYTINTLDADDFDSVWIPSGFAHGFLSFKDGTTVVNRCTGEFSAEHERGILWNDPFFKISWPVEDPILSEKDKSWKLWSED
jgi:dTDP-4-dehydrorhamnose 3,5-epimerase